MTAAVELSPFATAAPALSAMGYSCLPLVPPTVTRMRGRGKMPGTYTGGHWQGADKWERRREVPLQGFELGLAMKAPGANVGVVLGTVARPGLFVIAVDVDAEDADTVDAIVRCLPASPMVKRGAKGRTLFYAAPKTVTSRSFDDHRIPRDAGIPRRLVDILTGFATKQTVCPPSVHPDGPVYTWLAGPVAASELPLFDDDALTVLEETLHQFGYDPDASRGGRGERKPYVPTEGADTSGDAFDVAKRAALANIGAWIHDVENLHGLRPARGGFEAVSLMRDSSSGQPLERRKRNLSIQQNGIRDWGTDETFSAIDLVAHHNGLTVSEALSWLEERLDLRDDCVVINLRPPPEKETAPPVLAERTNEAAPSEKVVGEKTAATIPNAVQGETHGDKELPAHLIRECPGLLGGLAQYITDSARKPQPTLSLVTALTIIGTAAGRRYAGPTMSGTHLYTVMVGGSGAGKEHQLEMAATILQAAGMPQHLGPGEFMSFQALYKDLCRKPLMLCAIDELGSFLGRLSRKGASGNEGAISAVLRSAWGKSFGRLAVPSWAGFDAADVYVPALSILGASTPDEFFKSLESGAIDNGFLNRWLLFPAYTRPKQRRPIADKFDVPLQIVDGLTAIYNVGGGAMANATMHNGRADKPAIQATWEGGAEGPLATEFLEWAAALDEQSDTETLFARVAEQTIRVATIRAIGSDAFNPVIDRACFEWARSLVEWCTDAMISQAADFMAENQTQADRGRVLRAIKSAGAISHRDLTRKLTSFKARELDEIVKTLIAAEQVQAANVVNETNGKTTKLYTYTGGE